MCGKRFLFTQSLVSLVVAAGAGSGQQGPYERVFLNLKL